MFPLSVGDTFWGLGLGDHPEAVDFTAVAQALK